jgi:dihydrofolate reductase
VSKLRFKISMSLDGFVAGPSQSVDDPLGIGGMRLHEWVFPLANWRAMHGLEGGEVNESSPVIEESLANIGATVMGRNMFGGHPGPWNPKDPWNGWWGADPPFHHPVFVLTHHARELLELEGGTTFTFVTGGIEAALEQARRAAGGQDVSLAGGATPPNSTSRPASWTKWRSISCRRSSAAVSGCSMASATICTGSSSCGRSPRPRSRTSSLRGAERRPSPPA